VVYVCVCVCVCGVSVCVWCVCVVYVCVVCVCVCWWVCDVCVCVCGVCLWCVWCVFVVCVCVFVTHSTTQKRWTPIISISNLPSVCLNTTSCMWKVYLQLPLTTIIGWVRSNFTYCGQRAYRCSDTSLARPGWKQARKHVRDARAFDNIEPRAVIKFFFFCKSRRRRKFTPFW